MKMLPLSVYCAIAAILTISTSGGNPGDEDILEEIDTVLNKLSKVLSERQGSEAGLEDTRNKRYYGGGCPRGMVHCPGRYRVCIKPSQFCDGKSDCPKSLDENERKCLLNSKFSTEKRTVSSDPEQATWYEKETHGKCAAGEISCGGKRGKCISRDFLCDGYVDCYPDKWDESSELCSKQACPQDMTKCNTTSQCILQRDLCNDVRDCDDYEDENTNTCGRKRCGGSTSLCTRSNICLEDDFWCDGYEDCVDGEDEDPPSCARVPCNGLRCGDGVCVPTDSYCDGYADCMDGSDEDQDRCGPIRCPRGTFRCKEANSCVSMAMICDGIWDCPNGDDERKDNCVAMLIEPSETFMERSEQKRSHLSELLARLQKT